MAKTVLLDLDGTLVDSAPDLAAAVNQLLYDLGHAPLPLPQVTAMVGDGAAKLVERALAASGIEHGPEFLPDAVERFLEFYMAGLVVETQLYPGVMDTLDVLQARGWRLAVCTNKPEKPTRGILDILGVSPLIDAVLGGDSLPVKKPDPAHPLALLTHLGAGPQEAVMVGDGRNDILAARQAGIAEIWARYGYGGAAVEAMHPKHAIDRFADLEELLAREDFAA